MAIRDDLPDGAAFNVGKPGDGKRFNPDKDKVPTDEEVWLSVPGIPNDGQPTWNHWLVSGLHSDRLDLSTVRLGS